MVKKSLIVLFRYFLILPNRNETKRNYRNTEIYRNSSVSVVHCLSLLNFFYILFEFMVVSFIYWYTWLKTILPGWIWTQSSEPGHWHRVGLHLASSTGFSNGNEICPIKASSHSQIVGSSSSLLQILVILFRALEAILFRVSVSLSLILKMIRIK